MSDTVNILKQAQNLDASFAQVLGSKLPATTSINDASKVLSAAPVEIILNSKPADIVNNLANIDLGNMDVNKKSVLARQVKFWIFKLENIKSKLNIQKSF